MVLIDPVNFAAALDTFMETIDYTLESSVPDPIPFQKKLENLVDDNKEFVVTQQQHSAVKQIIDEVGEFERLNGKKNMSRQLESEQEREQEQEQQREVKAKRDQQIEVEKFIDREYSRADEYPQSWSFSLLGNEIDQKTILTKENSEIVKIKRKLDSDHPFNELKKFRLRHQEPLDFPNYLFTSRNYFNPNWTGLRRVKNVVMVMEWVPNTKALQVVKGSGYLKNKNKNKNKKQNIALEKAYNLLAARTGEMTAEDTYNAIRAACDEKVTDEELNNIMNEFGKNGKLSLESFTNLLTSGKLRPVEHGRYFVALSLAEAETIRRIIHVKQNDKQLIDGKDIGIALRYTPMATFGGGAASAIDNNSNNNNDDDNDDESSNKMSKEDMELAKYNKNLQNLLQHGIVFDCSSNWLQDSVTPQTSVSKYQLSVAHNSMRFLDCSMHFTEPALNVLVRTLQNNSTHARERFFYTTIGSRRRMERKWQETPLAKVFTVPDEWFALKQRAQAVFIREAIKNKKLTLWEAFTAFDSDDNGVLSPAEFYGAVKWLGVPDITPNDVVDMIEAADRNRDGLIDYKEYMFMLKDFDEQVDDTMEEENNDDDNSIISDSDDDDDDNNNNKKRKKNSKPIIEPYGAEILREVMINRKRDELQRQREDRLRRMAYQQALDIRVFEEELRASKKRKGGPNPKLAVVNNKNLIEEKMKEQDEINKENLIRQVLFSFTTNQRPLRMVSSGTCKFSALNGDTLLQAAQHAKVVMPCSKGHSLRVLNRPWNYCNICKAMGTRFYCASSCYYYVCARCNERYIEEKKKSLTDLSDKHTFLECTNGSSFTLQVPAFVTGIDSSSITNNNKEEDSEQKNNSDSDDDENTKLNIATPLKIECIQFSITMEIRIERLPPKQLLIALLRFSPPGSGRSRQKNKASVYIDENGTVGNSDKIPFEHVENMNDAEIQEILPGKPAPMNKRSSSKSIGPQPIHCIGLHDLKWRATEDESRFCDRCKLLLDKHKTTLSCKICNYDCCLDCVEKYEKFVKNRPAGGGIVPSKWHVVTVSVDSEKGSIMSYIDGKLCSISEGNRKEDLILQHQLVVFGGSKQGFLRGGSIRRLFLNNYNLNPKQALDMYNLHKNDKEILLVWCNFCKNIKHLPIRKHFEYDAGLTIKTFVEEKEAYDFIKTNTIDIQCLVVTLAGEYKDDDDDDDYINKKNNNNKQDNKLEEEIKYIKTYDILYDDGDTEEQVLSQNVKPVYVEKKKQAKLKPDQLQLLSKENLNVDIVYNLEALEDAVSLACLKSHKYESINLRKNASSNDKENDSNDNEDNKDNKDNKDNNNNNNNNNENKQLTDEEKHEKLTPGCKFIEKIRDFLPKAPIVLDTTLPPEKERELIVGEQIQALYKGSAWYRGTITKIHKKEKDKVYQN